jgi:hypothetical protein
MAHTKRGILAQIHSVEIQHERLLTNEVVLPANAPPLLLGWLQVRVVISEPAGLPERPAKLAQFPPSRLERHLRLSRRF